MHEYSDFFPHCREARAHGFITSDVILLREKFLLHLRALAVDIFDARISFVSRMATERRHYFL